MGRKYEYSIIMIQRIQSVYLSLIVILGGIYCSRPALTFFDFETNKMLNFFLFPVTSWHMLPIIIISLVIPINAFITLLSFKNRVWQMRLCIVNIVICAGYYAMLFLYRYFMLYAHGDELVVVANKCYPTVWAAIPLVCLVLTVMSLVRIAHDEALVHASEHLR